MRNHYFNQETADLDDKMLSEAIDQGRVPKTCLLGGVLVQEFAKHGDPCSRCACPKRDVCGGRPQVEAFVLEETTRDLRSINNNESGARRLMRRTWIRELMRAGKEAKK